MWRSADRTIDAIEANLKAHFVNSFFKFLFLLYKLTIADTFCRVSSQWNHIFEPKLISFYSAVTFCCFCCFCYYCCCCCCCLCFCFNFSLLYTFEFCLTLQFAFIRKVVASSCFLGCCSCCLYLQCCCNGRRGRSCSWVQLKHNWASGQRERCAEISLIA